MIVVILLYLCACLHCGLSQFLRANDQCEVLRGCSKVFIECKAVKSGHVLPMGKSCDTSFVYDTMEVREVRATYSHYERVLDTTFTAGIKATKVTFRKIGLTTVCRGAFTETGKVTQHLDLSENTLTSIDNEVLREVQKLRILNLSFNHLTTLQGKAFSPLSDLEELYLSSNSIKRVSREAFEGLGQLRILDLSFNKIHTLRPETLQPVLPSLDSIFLTNNDFRCDCTLHWLRQLTPCLCVLNVDNCKRPWHMRNETVDGYQVHDCPAATMREIQCEARNNTCLFVPIITDPEDHPVPDITGFVDHPFGTFEAINVINDDEDDYIDESHIHDFVYRSYHSTCPNEKLLNNDEILHKGAFHPEDVHDSMGVHLVVYPLIGAGCAVVTIGIIAAVCCLNRRMSYFASPFERRKSSATVDSKLESSQMLCSTRNSLSMAITDSLVEVKETTS